MHIKIPPVRNLIASRWVKIPRGVDKIISETPVWFCKIKSAL